MVKKYIDFKIRYIIQDYYATRIKVAFYSGEYRNITRYDDDTEKEITNKEYVRTEQLFSKKYTFTNNLLVAKEEDKYKDIVSFESPLEYIEIDKMIPSYDDVRIFLISKLEELAQQNSSEPIDVQKDAKNINLTTSNTQ